MKTLLTLCLLCVLPLALRAEFSPPKVPARIGTTEDFRQLLLATKWTWRNVSAGVPDRECVFMPDGTFRHPHFIATYIIKDVHTVELHRRDGNAILNFDRTYTGFEAIDFRHKRRITGQRL